MRIIEYMRKNVALQHYALMVLFAFIAYWPLSSLHHATRWDSVESYFPFRYFISDCLRNGELPLWCPYQLGGYPFYADPQSGAWYPVAWIFCSLGRYTLSWFAVEFMCTVFIGGLGMYRLVKSFDLDDRAALIAGMSYIACGFFISNAEHITWVVSAGWLTWVFWSYHRLITSGKYGYALLAGLCLYLLLSGGYPAFITVALYLLILFFLVLMFRRQPAPARWKLLWLHAAMAGVFLVVSAGILLSWYQFIPLISRGEAMSLEEVYVHPFSPRCAESFLLPFVTLKGTEIYNSDVSMRNAYIGLSCLLMLPFVRLRNRNMKLLVVGIVALFCLAAAAGPYLPVRAWLYHFVPMMRLFRFPSLFRIFFIIGAILISAHGTHAFLQNVPGNRRRLAWIVMTFLGVFILIFGSSILMSGFTWGWGHDLDSFWAHLVEAARSEHIQLQCMVQIILLGGLLTACLYRGGRFLTPRALIIFCMADMILASALNAYGTVVAMQRRGDQEDPIKDAPRHFTVPDPTIPVAAYSDLGRNMGLMRTNTSIYFKTPAADGYNTFLLNTFNRLDASPVRDSVRANPYLYFASAVATGADSTQLGSKTELRVDTSTYLRLRMTKLALDSGQHIKVSSFLPNEIIATVSTRDSALLNLQQSYAVGWSLSVDGKETPLIITNYTQMAGIIPPGEHRVVWTYNPPFIRFMAIWTVVSLVLLLAALGVYRRRLL